MTPDEKLDCILAELQQIRELLRSNSSPPTKNLTIKQAASFLNLSVARLYELVYTGKIVPLQHKKYHRIQFSLHTLQQYLNENSQRP
ncbi:MAG: helix-turn-helix domain-containing protein [Bacteroidota bacterium]|nr:helix-turn-helix domain-containing protein [Bacteroidota bacterium]